MHMTKKVRMNRLFNNGRCLDVAIDHGVCNEPSFMDGLEDMASVVDAAGRRRPGRDPDELRPGRPAAVAARRRPSPALVMRIDMGNPYNRQPPPR